MAVLYLILNDFSLSLHFVAIVDVILNNFIRFTFCGLRSDQMAIPFYTWPHSRPSKALESAISSQKSIPIKSRYFKYC